MKTLTFTLLLTFYSLCTFAQQAGTLDITFNNTGIKVFQVPNNIAELGQVIAEQPDGKILVAGSTDLFNAYDGFVARYNANGVLDPTFHMDGKVTMSLSDVNYDHLIGIAVRPDNKIMVAGQMRFNNNTDIMLARLLPDGNFDTNFGIFGVMKYDVGNVTNDRALGLELLPDGKMLVYGYVNASPDYGFVVRFDSLGVADNTFGTNGVFTWKESGVTRFNALEILPGGKIVLGGYEVTGGEKRATLIGLTANGSPDNGFGTGGKASYPMTVSTGEIITDIKISPDNTQLITLAYTDETNADIVVSKFSLTGGTVPSFGNNGNSIIDLSLGKDITRKAAIQPDGKILISGASNDKSYIARMNADGSMDNTFNVNGRWEMDVSPSNAEEITNIIITQSGKAVALGGMGKAGVYLPFLVRLNLGIFPLSVDPAPDASAINIYPNPAADQAIINFNIEGEIYIDVRDINGRSVFNKSFIGEGNTQHALDCSDWATGLYIIRIYNKESQFQTKFLKQ